MENVSELFDFGTIVTLGGASAAVAVLTNTVYLLFGSRSVLVAFVASQVIAWFGALTNVNFELSLIFIATLNGCLLFCIAVGIQETSSIAQPREAAMAGTVAGLGHRKWTDSWFH